MRKLPVWAWGAAACGLAAIVAGGVIDDSYAQNVLLQLGTAALLLVPILLAERSIGRRLSRQFDDHAVIRKAEAALHLDDMWRDFGQKMGGKVKAVPLAEIERALAAGGWDHHRTLDGYRLWHKDTKNIAVPDSSDGPVPAPHVRMILRAMGLTEDEFQERSLREP